MTRTVVFVGLSVCFALVSLAAAQERRGARKRPGRGKKPFRLPAAWQYTAPLISPEKREKEQDGGEHLVELVGRIKAAMDEWRGTLVDLGRWIKYGPPPPEVREDPFDDTDDDEPETIH